MKQILWFRRDLRVSDSAILANAKDEVLPIFIFDKNILDKLSKDDKRVSFIYKSVLELKEKLKAINLDLAIFYGTPKEIFEKLKTKGFDSAQLILMIMQKKEMKRYQKSFLSRLLQIHLLFIQKIV
jgi:deoxyribodipyrimidine photo-lyase